MRPFDSVPLITARTKSHQTPKCRSSKTPFLFRHGGFSRSLNASSRASRRRCCRSTVYSDQTLACFLESSSTSAEIPILSGLTYFWHLIVSIFVINPLTIPLGRVYQQSAGESIHRKDISSTYTPEQTQLGNCLFFPRGRRRTET